MADAVADELEPSTEQISLEILFRGFYHFNHAYSCGKASDHIAYFTARENQDLRIVKYEHKSRIGQQLNLSAYPTWHWWQIRKLSPMDSAWEPVKEQITITNNQLTP